MGKTEIIEELTRLSPEDLSEVKAWLDRVSLEKHQPSDTSARLAHIRSPRLARRAQLKDFVKQVKELPTNGAL